MISDYSSKKIKVADPQQVRHARGICEEPDANGEIKPCKYCNSGAPNLSDGEISEIMTQGTLKLRGET